MQPSRWLPLPVGAEFSVTPTPRTAAKFNVTREAPNRPRSPDTDRVGTSRGGYPRTAQGGCEAADRARARPLLSGFQDEAGSVHRRRSIGEQPIG